MGVKPRRIAVTINTEDVMPTLLSLCGLSIPKTVEGHDFAGAMRGGADPSGGATVIRCVSPFGEYQRKTGGREYRGVRSAQHTYVEDLKGPWLLYDNISDPYQLTNLVSSAAHATQQKELAALLKKKLAEQQDQFLPGSDYITKWGYRVDANETMPYQP